MALKITSKIEGIEKVRKKMAKLGDAGDAAVRTAIYKVAHEIMEKSIRITPLDDGWLRNTWYISKPYKHIGFAELGFGADYAHHVHEMPKTLNWSEPDTGPKFLEIPFMERRSTLASDIAKIARSKFNPDKVMGSFPKGGVPDKPETGPGPKK